MPDRAGNVITMWMLSKAHDSCDIHSDWGRCGGNSGACYGQMYVMNVLIRRGSQMQKDLLPKIASGELRRQYDSRVNGLASHLVWTNRSKENIALDVEDPEAREVLGEHTASILREPGSSNERIERLRGVWTA